MLRAELEDMTDASVAFTSTQEREQKYKDAEARFGKCPLCKSHHTYRRTVGSEQVST